MEFKKKKIKEIFQRQAYDSKRISSWKIQIKKKDELEKQQERENQNSPDQQKQQQERAKREQILRSKAELQGKYNSYSSAVQEIQRRNNGKIPELGTEDGNLRHRYIQAMQAIEQLARDQGFGLS